MPSINHINMRMPIFIMNFYIMIKHMKFQNLPCGSQGTEASRRVMNVGAVKYKLLMPNVFSTNPFSLRIIELYTEKSSAFKILFFFFG